LGAKEVLGANISVKKVILQDNIMFAVTKEQYISSVRDFTSLGEPVSDDTLIQYVFSLSMRGHKVERSVFTIKNFASEVGGFIFFYYYMGNLFLMPFQKLNMQMSSVNQTFRIQKHRKVGKLPAGDTFNNRDLIDVRKYLEHTRLETHFGQIMVLMCGCKKSVNRLNFRRGRKRIDKVLDLVHLVRQSRHLRDIERLILNPRQYIMFKM
jgi:hypothetical protein